MSYLDELEDIISSTPLADKAPTTQLTNEFYRELLSILMSRAVWVFYDAYNTPKKVSTTNVSKPDRDAVSRIDLFWEPTLMVKSASLNQLATDLSIKRQYGPIYFADMVSDMRGRRTRKVMVAGLRDFERTLVRTFGRPAFVQMSDQSRHVVFRLNPLMRQIGAKRQDLCPGPICRYLDARDARLADHNGESDSSTDGV